MAHILVINPNSSKAVTHSMEACLRPFTGNGHEILCIELEGAPAGIETDAHVAEVVPLYARYFSPDEMKQLAAFYRTPVGKKSLQVMPKLMGEGMQAGQRVIAPRINKLMQELNQQQIKK